MELFNPGNVEVKITFTTRCTAKCETCLNPTIKNHYDLDWPTYKRIIEEILKIKEVNLVSFYSIGESYLNDESLEKIEWAMPLLKKKGIKTCIVTNASVGTKIPKGIDNYFISFNSGRKATYEKITKLDFDKVVGNIKQLYESGQYKNAKDFQIHMLVFKDNRDEREDFKKLFANMKNVKLRFSYKYDNQHGESEGKGLNLEKKKIPCDYLTNKIIFYPNGDVVLCSHDFLGTVKFGNINKQPLQEILSNPQRLDLIKDQNEGIYKGICSSCDYNSVSGDNLIEYFDSDPNESVRNKSILKRITRKILNKFSFK